MEKTVTTLDSEDRLGGEAPRPQIGRDGKWQFNMYDPDDTRVELMEFTAASKPCCSGFTAAQPQPHRPALIRGWSGPALFAPRVQRKVHGLAAASPCAFVQTTGRVPPLAMNPIVRLPHP